jgi:hypothetical protein
MKKAAPREGNDQQDKPINTNTIRGIRHILAGINCLRLVEHPTEADVEIIALVINQVEVARLLLDLRGGAL